MDQATPPATREAARPYWLAGPCPAWCEERHGDDDHIEDRRHVGGADPIPLTLAAPTMYRTGTGRGDVAFQPRVLMVEIEQGWRESEPEICLSDDDSTVLRLTVAEFRALVARGIELVDGSEASP